MINQTCSLILKDLYSYDIQSAYGSIMSSHNYDFKDTDLENKEDRSIFIGKQQIGNENLSSFLMESVDNLVRFYLKENHILESEIIVTQRDGFIIKKMLENNDEFIEMKFRGFIDFLIIAPDRQKYLYSSDGNITVKGVSDRYDDIDKIYQRFSNLCFYNKSILFDQMEQIKQVIINSQDKKMFMIPKDSTFLVFTYKGITEIKDQDLISIDSIYKLKYFNHFFKDFLTSVFLECC